jgi:hypothetical protein
MVQIDSMVQFAIDALHNAVQLAFQPNGDPRRVERFDSLRVAMCNTMTMLLRERAVDYVAAARSGIDLLFSVQGIPLNSGDISIRLEHVLCECAMTELVVPVVCNPKAICEQLRQKEAPFVESCADERAELAHRKQDLTNALSKVKKI